MSYNHIEVDILKVENLLQVRVIPSGEVFYFRDVKGNEIKYFEWMMKEKGDLKIMDCFDLVGRLIHPRGNNLEGLKSLDYEIFEEVFDCVVSNILSDIIPWFDFLELAFAMGKKSYSILPWLLDQEMTTIWDLYHSMKTFLQRESDYIKAQTNSPSMD